MKSVVLRNVHNKRDRTAVMRALSPDRETCWTAATSFVKRATSAALLLHVVPKQLVNYSTKLGALAVLI